MIFSLAAQRYALPQGGKSSQRHGLFPLLFSAMYKAMPLVSISAKSSEEPDGRPARLPSSLPYPIPDLKERAYAA